MTNKITVKQTSRYNIYQFDLLEIDPNIVAKNIRSLLAEQPRRDENTAVHKGFHLFQTDIFTKETNHLFDDLIQVIENKVIEVLEDESLHYKTKLVNITPVVETFWCIMYKKGDKADWHRHQNIYCYQAVYYPEDSEDISPIVFEDLHGFKEIRPKKGSLIIFDGTIKHMVPEIISEKERLVFASNLLFVRRDNK